MAGMNEELMADVIEGSVRLAWSGATTDAALVIEELRSGAESLGGTVTVDCCPVGMDPVARSAGIMPVVLLASSIWLKLCPASQLMAQGPGGRQLLLLGAHLRKRFGPSAKAGLHRMDWKVK